MLSVARYSFLNPPTVFSTPQDKGFLPPNQTQYKPKLKQGKRLGELLKVLQDFHFSHSEINFYLKDKDMFTVEHDKTKVLVFDSENSNADAVGEL